MKLFHHNAAAAKSLQSCPTLCDPIDGSPPGFPVPGILQARTLEWVAISFSNEWKWKVKVKSFSRIQLFATPWTAAYQAPPSMGFSRQEYWSGGPSPSPSECLRHTLSSKWLKPSSSSLYHKYNSVPVFLKLTSGKVMYPVTHVKNLVDTLSFSLPTWLVCVYISLIAQLAKNPPTM